MLENILIPFVTVGLAELGDKTQLTILFLSSNTKNRLSLLLGVLLAFILVDGAAILVGGWIVNFISRNLVKILAGSIFIIFGVLILISKREKIFKAKLENPFYFGFISIFLSEWGDKTQVASALFAARYNWVLVFISIIMALGLISTLTIYLGKFLFKKLKGNTLKKASGIVFIVIGVTFFLF